MDIGGLRFIKFEVWNEEISGFRFPLPNPYNVFLRPKYV